MKRVLAAWASFKLFRDFAVLASGQIGSKLLGFLAFAWLARALDPEAYGGLEYVVGLAVFFAALVDGGLGTIGVRRTAKDPAVLPRLAFQIPVARLLIAMVSVPVMVLLATAAMGSQVPAPLIWLFALSVLTGPWRQEWLMQATERMTEAAIAQIIRALVFVAGVWFLVKGTDDLVTVGWVEVASVLAMSLYCIVVQHFWITPFRVRGDFSGFWPMIREGAAISSTSVVWALMQTLPIIIIGAMVGGVEVALFAAAARLVGSVLTFSQIYHFNLFPAVSRAGAADLASMAQLLRRSFRVVAWGGMFGALALTLFAEPVMRLLFGEKLIASTPIMAILIWSLPIALCSGHARWGLTALGEQRKVLLAHLVGLVVMAVLCPVLGYAMGGEGYAIGALAGPIGVWAAAHLFAKLDGNDPPSFLLMLRPAAATAAVLGAAFWLDLGPLARIVGLAAFVLAAPVLDRKLIPDIGFLGRAKMS